MADVVMDFRQPPAALADHFSFIYRFTHSDGHFQAVDRADFGQLRFILSGHDGRCTFVDGKVQEMPDIYVMGPTTGNTINSGEGDIDVVGVGLMPAGWAALVPMDASAAANRLFDARDLFGTVVSRVLRQLRATPDFDARVRIMEAMLAELMAAEEGAHHSFVQLVNGWIAGDLAPKVEQLVNRSGLSRSQVERKCNRFFGLPPKLLARKYRALRAALAMIHHDAAMEDILGDHFYDQSHFIRELKHFTGMTPTVLADNAAALSQQMAKRIELERSNPLSRTPVIT